MDKIKIESWMRHSLKEYLDCGEVNCTQLAEGAAQVFDLTKDAEMEELFEMAFSVTDRFEHDYAEAAIEYGEHYYG